MMKVSIGPADRDRITVSVETRNGPTSGELDAAGVDDLVRALVGARRDMLPVHAAVPDEERNAPYVGDNMLWQVRPAPARPGIELAIQNPGLGWIGMTLSRAQVEDLIVSFEFALAQMRQVAPAKPVLAAHGGDDGALSNGHMQ